MKPNRKPLKSKPDIQEQVKIYCRAMDAGEPMVLKPRYRTIRKPIDFKELDRQSKERAAEWTERRHKAFINVPETIEVVGFSLFFILAFFALMSRMVK